MRKILFLTIICLFLFPNFILAETDTVPSGIPTDEIEGKVDQIMNDYTGEDNDIPGAAIAIVKDGKIILEKGYGMSDVESQKEVDPEKTVFEAASISKVYTWSAVMQLVEAGEIDLNEDIRTYLPDDYLDLKFSDAITMYDLMNHTAGFEDTTEQLLVTDSKKIIPLKDYLSKQHEQPNQIFRPGTVTAYSNYSTSLAGLIVENVSGESFTEYMNTKVLQKLDMKDSAFDTDYSHLSYITDNKSKGYLKEKRQFVEEDWGFVNDAPAGSLNTTVHDMAHFMLAHLGSDDYQLFEQEATLKEMHKSTSDFTENAHGFWERSVNGYRILEHGGNSTGFTTQMTLVPEENFGMVLFMNVGDEMSAVRIDLMNQLVGEQVIPDNVKDSNNDEKVEDTYRMARGKHTNFLKLLPIISNADVNVKQHESGGITLQTATDQEPIHYVETENLVYERVDDTIPLMDKAGMDTSRVEFKLDEQDNVIKMTFGVVSDFLPVHVKDRFGVNLLVIIISVLTFLTYTINAFVQWIRRKRKKLKPLHVFRATTLLTNAGLLVVMNIIILFIRFIQDPFQKLATFQIQLWLNYLLPLSFIVAGYFTVKQWKATTALRNSARIFLLVVSLVFILFLVNFNLL